MEAWTCRAVNICECYPPDCCGADPPPGCPETPTNCDVDRDGVRDRGPVCEGDDNCSGVFNPAQTDTDDDGYGDACDADIDGDGIWNNDDNCPFTDNPDQEDDDSNGVGDACEPPADTDRDGILDFEDNCPSVYNPSQGDTDGDGIGDPCDDDFDGDGVSNAADNCPKRYNPLQADSDGDGVGDECERTGLDDEDCAFVPDPCCGLTPCESCGPDECPVCRSTGDEVHNWHPACGLPEPGWPGGKLVGCVPCEHGPCEDPCSPECTHLATKCAGGCFDDRPDLWPIYCNDPCASDPCGPDCTSIPAKCLAGCSDDPCCRNPCCVTPCSPACFDPAAKCAAGCVGFGPGSDCCQNPDPCRPECGGPDNPCCRWPDLCCGNPDVCCDSVDPCVCSEDPCSALCDPDPCDPACGGDPCSAECGGPCSPQCINCDDQDPCTDDICVGGACEHPCRADCSSCPLDFCVDCACEPGTCSLSLSPESAVVCPGGSVELTLQVTCDPCDHTFWTIDISSDKVHADPSSGQLECPGSDTVTIVITVDQDAPMGTVNVVAIGNGPGSAHCESSPASIVIERTKVPLGYSVHSTSDPDCFKVYMPTKWGGKLTVATTDGTIVNLRYPDGTPYENGTETGEDKHKWYTFEVVGSDDYTVSATFLQEGQAPRRPWNFYWWSAKADYIHEPNGGNGIADTLANSQDEQIIAVGAPAQGFADIVRSGPDGFLDSTSTGDDLTRNVVNLFDRYGDYTPLADYDAYWHTNTCTEQAQWSSQFPQCSNEGYGHCRGAAIASMFRNQPVPTEGRYNTEELEGLWALLGDNDFHALGARVMYTPPGPPTAGEDPTDSSAPKYHAILELLKRANTDPLLSDLRAVAPGSGVTPDDRWNHAIYRFEALYREAPDANERVVHIQVQVYANEDTNVLPSTGVGDRTVQYTYIIEYQEDGVTDTRDAARKDWISVDGQGYWIPQSLVEILLPVFRSAINEDVTEDNVGFHDSAN